MRLKSFILIQYPVLIFSIVDLFFFQWTMSTPSPHLIPTHANQLAISRLIKCGRSFSSSRRLLLTFLWFLEDRNGQVNSKTATGNLSPRTEIHKQKQRKPSQDVQDADWLGDRPWQWTWQACVFFEFAWKCLCGLSSHVKQTQAQSEEIEQGPKTATTKKTWAQEQQPALKNTTLVSMLHWMKIIQASSVEVTEVAKPDSDPRHVLYTAFTKKETEAIRGLSKLFGGHTYRGCEMR